jgi:hypothetical protein
MSIITEHLLRASNLEKTAYHEYVKSFASAGIAALVNGGISLEKASSLVKEACLTDKHATNLKTAYKIFEKTAEYVKELEEKVSELEKFSEATKEEKAIEESTPLSKLASIGFTKEELLYMNSLPENLITKVASIGSKPWEMGSVSGVSREVTDPLLEFLLA